MKCDSKDWESKTGGVTTAFLQSFSCWQLWEFFSIIWIWNHFVLQVEGQWKSWMISVWCIYCSIFPIEIHTQNVSYSTGKVCKCISQCKCINQWQKVKLKFYKWIHACSNKWQAYAGQLTNLNSNAPHSEPFPEYGRSKTKSVLTFSSIGLAFNWKLVGPACDPFPLRLDRSELPKFISRREVISFTDFLRKLPSSMHSIPPSFWHWSILFHKMRKKDSLNWCLWKNVEIKNHDPVWF